MGNERHWFLAAAVVLFLLLAVGEGEHGVQLFGEHLGFSFPFRSSDQILPWYESHSFGPVPIAAVVLLCVAWISFEALARSDSGDEDTLGLLTELAEPLDVQTNVTGPAGFYGHLGPRIGLQLDSAPKFAAVVSPQTRDATSLRIERVSNQPGSTGDARLDSALLIGGSPLLLAGALDEPTRDALVRLAAEAFVLWEDNSVVLDLGGFEELHADDFSKDTVAWAWAQLEMVKVAMAGLVRTSAELDAMALSRAQDETDEEVRGTVAAFVLRPGATRSPDHNALAHTCIADPCPYLAALGARWFGRSDLLRAVADAGDDARITQVCVAHLLDSGEATDEDGDRATRLLATQWGDTGIAALAEIGSARHIEGLKATMQQTDRAAQVHEIVQAIDAIRGRLDPHMGAGQLALSEVDSDGRLSEVAAETTGGLSEVAE